MYLLIVNVYVNLSQAKPFNFLEKKFFRAPLPIFYVSNIYEVKILYL